MASSASSSSANVYASATFVLSNVSHLIPIKLERGKISTSIKPENTEWVIQDRNLVTIWDNLEKRYAAPTRSHIIQLKKQLQTVKKGILSMQDYLQQIKIIADKLAACGSTGKDSVMIIHTLDDFPASYRSFKTAINTRSMADPVTLGELTHSSYM